MIREMRSFYLLEKKIIPLILLCMLGGTVFAQKYKVGYKQKGKASYYGKKFHGRPTASGEKFNMNAYTCAHLKLPFGTMLKVTHLKSKKWVVVRVNDRGPFKSSRILDLSQKAAEKIGMIREGVSTIQLEIISLKPTNKGGSSGSGKAKPKQKPKDKKQAVVRPDNNKEKFEKTGSYNIWGAEKDLKGTYGAQLGVYSMSDRAVNLGRKAFKKGLKDIYIQVGWVKGKKCYRVLYGSVNYLFGHELVKGAKRKGFRGAFLKKHL